MTKKILSFVLIIVILISGINFSFSKKAEAATFVNDTFTDAAGTLLENRSGELGSTWLKHPNFSGNIAVTNNSRIRNDSGISVYYTSGIPSSANYTVQADIYVQSIGSTTDYIGPAARINTSSPTFYWTLYNDVSSEWQLLEFNNGSATILGSYSATLTPSTTYSVALTVDGNNLSVTINGNTIITATNGDITSAGKAGIVASFGVTNTTGQHLDNFSASDIGGAPATSYSLSGPTNGSINITSTNFTVTPNGTYTGTITPSDSGNGGTFSPTSLTFASSSAPQTFTYTPTDAGNKTISVTSNPTLTNPTSVSYLVAATNFSDNFNRSDGAIGNGWLGATPTATISSNRLNVSPASGDVWMTGLVLRPSNEVTVDQKVSVKYISGSSGDLWFTLRTQSPGTEYMAGMSIDGHANIWKSINGSLTAPIIQSPFSYNSGHNYQVDASATGTNPTNLQVTVTDVTTNSIVAVATTTDSTSQFQQNGQVGFFAAGGAITIDDFIDYTVNSSSIASSYTLTGPTSGTVNTASTNFTVTPNGLYTGTITPISNGAGTFSPTSLTFASSSAAQTFTYTPSSTSNSPHTISVTSSPALINPNPISYTVNVPSSSISVNNPSLYWSRSNVYVNGSSHALMLTTGSYLKTNFSGTSIAVNIDVSPFVSASVSSINYPIVRYQTDGGAWTTTQLTSTTTSIRASGLSSGTHTFRFEYVSASTFTDKWNTPVNAIKVTSLNVDSGSTVSSPTIQPKLLRVDGDSITEGLRVINTADTSSSNSAVQDYAYLLAQSLGTELTQIGYGSQGWTTSGQGNVPSYPNAVDYYYNGVSRLTSGVLPQAPDYWLVNQGTNDGGDVTSAYVTRISQMRTEAGSSTQILLLVPFNQSHKAQITSAYNSYVSAHPSDTRVHLLDLGSISYGTTDGLHPNVAGHQTLATALASAITNVIDVVPPVISTISSGAPFQNSATISWTTNENATSQVVYGLSSSYTTSTTLNLATTTNHTVNLTGLTPGTTYHYVVTSTDIFGNTATSTDQTFTTLSPSNPVITTSSNSGYAPQTSAGGYASPITITTATPTNSSGNTTVVCANGELYNTQSGQPCGTTTSVITPSIPMDPMYWVFTKNLQLGSTNSEVKLLQQYLNTYNYKVALSGAGSPGNETSYFGPATKAALIKFQKGNSINPASGYFGPLTRAFIVNY